MDSSLLLESKRNELVRMTEPMAITSFNTEPDYI